MAHQSESEFKLKIRSHSNRKPKAFEAGSTYLFHYPTERSAPLRYNDLNFFLDTYTDFIDALPSGEVVCFLLDSLSACDLIAQLEGKLQYRLWIAVERDEPIVQEGLLPDNHVGLVVFTKDVKSFTHTVTRIQYTICPSCGRTTKDYGGKKHLYNPYGTLLADIWRDIQCAKSGKPTAILNRLADLFAVEPMKSLRYYDYRSDYANTEAHPIQVKKRRASEKKKQSAKSSLINDDCITAMKGMPPNSVDFAFADPPYNINKKYDKWDDGIEIENYFAWCDKWFKSVHRVLKPGRTFAILNIPLWIVRHYLFGKQLFDVQDLIVWEGLSLPVRNIMPAHYSILCLTKGKPEPIANYETQSSLDAIDAEGVTLKQWYCVRQACIRKRNKLGNVDREPLTNLWWDIHRIKHNSKRVDHPCQLPPALMRRLVHTFTKEGEVVLDPFNGAGTTTLVAEQMRRKYIGIELSLKYHKIALCRHNEIAQGLDPFRKRKATPKAKNSRVQRMKQQTYKVPKKTLQLEVKAIAQKLQRKPTKGDVKEHSQYPFEYFKEYFADWGEVCAAVGDKGMSDNPNKQQKPGWTQSKLL